MAKKLFLARYIPEGQVFCVMNVATGKKQRPGYRLFADKCDILIADKDADILVEQNKGLICLTPMDKETLEAEKEGYPKDSYDPDVVSKKILRGRTEPDLVASVEIEVKKLTDQVKQLKAELKKYTKKPEAVEPVVPVKNFVIDDDVKAKLKELAKLVSDNKFDKLKSSEIIKYGKELGIIISVTLKNADKLNALNSRAAELAKLIDSDDKDYGGQE